MCCLRHSNIDDCSGVACREEKLTTAAFFLSFTAFALPVQVLEAYCSNSRGLITIMYGHTYMECTTGCVPGCNPSFYFYTLSVYASNNKG